MSACSPASSCHVSRGGPTTTGARSFVLPHGPGSFCNESPGLERYWLAGPMLLLATSLVFYISQQLSDICDAYRQGHLQGHSLGLHDV